MNEDDLWDGLPFVNTTSASLDPGDNTDKKQESSWSDVNLNANSETTIARILPQKITANPSNPAKPKYKTWGEYFGMPGLSKLCT